MPRRWAKTTGLFLYSRTVGCAGTWELGKETPPSAGGWLGKARGHFLL